MSKGRSTAKKPGVVREAGRTKAHPPRIIAWEITKQCNLACSHCRAAASAKPAKGELSTNEGIRLLKNIKTLGAPVVILTGGEPLMRKDVFELAAAGKRLGLPMALATNGSLVTDEVAERIAQSGIRRTAISIDGVSSETHDALRGVQGSFNAAVKAASTLRKNNVPFQINTSVTKANGNELNLLYGLVRALGAQAWHVFMVVPVGRAVGIGDDLLDAARYEEMLHWLAARAGDMDIEIKPTCAPQYYRIIRQDALMSSETANNVRTLSTRGCLAGQGFAFISATGNVQPCGYFPVVAGNVRKHPFSRIWRDSALFAQLRNHEKYKGRCGRCEFFAVCGGCRARALATSGHFLDDDCYCFYTPRADAL